jgi:short-subunit dehydrogenase
MTDGTGKTVLITGTSGGIGRELAFVFAEHHFRIAATARSEEKLQELKQELENSCGVEVKAVQKDLTDKDAPHELYEEIQMAGICIDQLVNNAGVGKKDRLVDADPKTLEDLIQLNVTAPTLPRYFGQEMARRRQSRIVNVSSMDGFIPDPYFNIYGPTKAYDLFLTETMYGELEGTGVTVSALAPRRPAGQRTPARLIPRSRKIPTGSPRKVFSTCSLARCF